MTKEYLHGFDYKTYLQRHFMLGQVDPWRKSEDGSPLYTILVPLETAIAECKDWSKQEFSRTEFINYMKINDVLLFNNVEDYSKVIDKRQSERKISKRAKRQLTEEQKNKLREKMMQINATKKQESEKGSIS